MSQAPCPACPARSRCLAREFGYAFAIGPVCPGFGTPCRLREYSAHAAPWPPASARGCPTRSCPPRSPTAPARTSRLRNTRRGHARCPPPGGRRKRARAPAQNWKHFPPLRPSPWSARFRRRAACSKPARRSPICAVVRVVASAKTTEPSRVTSLSGAIHVRAVSLPGTLRVAEVDVSRLVDRGPFPCIRKLGGKFPRRRGLLGSVAELARDFHVTRTHQLLQLILRRRISDSSACRSCALFAALACR